MKLAEEILQGLNACSQTEANCLKCPYYILGCVACITDLMVDAEELIENLLEEKQQKEDKHD